VVYAEAPAATRWLKARGCTEIIPFDAGGTEALGYVRDGFRCVVFRGTLGAKDWITDLKSFYWDSPPVHCGFWLGWNKVKKDVFAWLESTHRANENVYFSGHSLGGAIATIAAYDWQGRGGKVEQVVTFGSPCPGSWEFAVRYDEAGLTAKTIRYQHDQDGICVIPPPILFSHVAPPIMLRIPAKPPGPAGILTRQVDTASSLLAMIGVLKPLLLGAAPAAGAMVGMLDPESKSTYRNPQKAALTRWSPSGAVFLFLLLPAAVQLIVSAPAAALWIAVHANWILADLGAFIIWLAGTLLAAVLLSLVTLRRKTGALQGFILIALLIAAAFAMGWWISVSPSLRSLGTWVARALGILAGAAVTQQAAFLLLIRVPIYLRIALSCIPAIAFGAVAFFSSKLPINGLLTLAVVFAGLLTILLYRLAAGAPDHQMVHYLEAIGGAINPTPREYKGQASN
jgi:hypothetical protein